MKIREEIELEFRSQFSPNNEVLTRDKMAEDNEVMDLKMSLISNESNSSRSQI